jgi:cytochrome P450
MIVLNSLSVIKDLLDKRASIYSNRPVLTVAGELTGFDQVSATLFLASFLDLTRCKVIVLMQYGPEWRLRRKLAHGALNSVAVKKYYSMQEELVVMAALSILESPEKFRDHIQL